MENRKTARFLSLALALAVMAFFSLNARAEAQNAPNIGVFNMAEVLAKSKKGQAAKKKYDATYDKIRKDIEAKQKEIDKLQQEFQSQAESKVLSQEALIKKRDALRDKIRDHQAQLIKYDEEIRKTEQAALAPAFEEAAKAAADVGRKRGCVIVLEIQQAGVFYYESSMDMTNDVIKALDS